ncbi:hypothetical protein Vadar_010928 [Vaccinium darrowii]|uniref:Uncharacterized protein n=1 Tax=Vaccinium darrowii TaxID=229202 RepID=A0ACB7XQQ1_9ERIC|nr:hypothetical protein Vadar_010928 [Vaccinium darrowii]
MASNHSLPFLLFLVFVSIVPRFTVVTPAQENGYHGLKINEIVEVLVNRGYTFMSMMLQETLTSLLPSENTSVTIFCPTDEAFANLKYYTQPPLPLLQYHIVPMMLDRESLVSTLPPESKVDTLLKGHPLVLTTTHNNQSASLNEVEITDWEIYNDGEVLIHGIKDFFDPAMQILLYPKYDNDGGVQAKNDTNGTEFDGGVIAKKNDTNNTSNSTISNDHHVTREATEALVLGAKIIRISVLVLILLASVIGAAFFIFIAVSAAKFLAMTLPKFLNLLAIGVIELVTIDDAEEEDDAVREPNENFDLDFAINALKEVGLKVSAEGVLRKIFDLPSLRCLMYDGNSQPRYEEILKANIATMEHFDRSIASATAHEVPLTDWNLVADFKNSFVFIGGALMYFP